MLAEQSAYRAARDTAEAFISQAKDSGRFESIGWVRPETMQALDCQLELSVSLESSSQKGVRYCLGRIVANIYDNEHSRLLDRVVLFHEVMYTPRNSKQPYVAYDGSSVHKIVRTGLFDQLMCYLADIPYSDKNSCSE
ncbi:MAG: hypothetical protein J5J06_09390 [Phycisphaerae bacterium]|nr:hypothetical protein [Phycisphaerae bacterium]